MGVWYYETYVPGTLYLTVYREGPYVPPSTQACPAPFQCAWSYDTTILDIFVHLNRIDTHSAGQTSQTGWRILIDSPGTIRMPNTSGLPSIPGWKPKLLPGIYDSLRFNVSSVTVNIQNVGNVSYAMLGGGFTPIWDSSQGGEFMVQAGRSAGVYVELRFLSDEIHARSGPLHAFASAVPYQL